MQEVARDRVDRAERLVHEQHVGVLRQRPRERHALLHPARELVRTSPLEAAQVHALEQVVRLPPPLGALLHAAQLQGQLDVLRRRQPREKRSFLEHQRHATLNLEPAARRRFQAGEHVQQRAFARAGRTDDADELARLQVEGHVLQRHEVAIGVRECLAQALYCDRAAAHRAGIGLLSGVQCRPHSFTAPSSHHQRPARSSSPGPVARVHGAHPMDV